MINVMQMPFVIRFRGARTVSNSNVLRCMKSDLRYMKIQFMFLTRFILATFNMAHGHQTLTKMSVMKFQL